MTHGDLITLWPSIAQFAKDLGIGYEAAKAMRRRGSVPASLWLRMVRAAEDRQIDGVSLQVLAELVDQPTQDAREAAE